MYTEYVKTQLLETFDYPSTEIDMTVKQIMSMSEEGQSIFTSFCETGVLPDKSANGLALLEMQRQSPKASPIALIIIYDGILKAINKMA